jgi:hypothetical protein
MTKQLTLPKATERSILVFIGRGKSTLTNFIGAVTIPGVKDAIKFSDIIKKRVALGERIIIHLEQEADVKKLPLGIKRRALVYKIDF